MHRLHPHGSLLGRAARVTSVLLLPLLLLGVTFVPDAAANDFNRPRAHAQHGDWFAIPDVARRTEADAMRTLEALGLTCRAEHVASAHVGHVLSTVPAAGTFTGRGQEIVLHVGVPIRVQTIVPHIRRRAASDVVASLSDIYAIVLNPVRGRARHEGRVVGQYPQAGAQLPFRGLLRLDVIDNSTTVPHVEGLPLGRATRRLERAGLLAAVREVPSADVARPTVLRQRPRAGSRVPYGSEVRLRVAVPLRDRAFRPHAGHAPHRGNANTGPYWQDQGHGHPGQIPGRIRGDLIRMPDVTGLRVREAQRLLRREGLSSTLASRGGLASGIVTGQSPRAGSTVARGTLVTLRTSLGRIFDRLRLRFS